MALKRRCPEIGLLHHSDRGSTYASADYQSLLDSRGLVCSMSRCEYQSNAAATRISFTNFVGDKRRADRAPSGTSKVTVAMVTPLTRLGTLPSIRTRVRSAIFAYGCGIEIPKSLSNLRRNLVARSDRGFVLRPSQYPSNQALSASRTFHGSKITSG